MLDAHYAETKLLQVLLIHWDCTIRHVHFIAGTPRAGAADDAECMRQKASLGADCLARREAAPKGGGGDRGAARGKDRQRRRGR